MRVRVCLRVLVWHSRPRRYCRASLRMALLSSAP